METEVRIDKRTKEYKESMKGEVESDRSGSTHKIGVAFNRESGFGEPVAVCTDPLDYSKIENNPGFKLCGKCGGDTLELNEDGSSKSRRQPEMCRDCVWENESKITCEDGVTRGKNDCKRITRMVAGDEVFVWVAK